MSMIMVARKPVVRPIIRTEVWRVEVFGADGNLVEVLSIKCEMFEFGAAMLAKGYDITDLSFDYFRTLTTIK